MKKILLLFRLLSSKEKKLFYLLIILTFLSMMLEIIGISTVIPLISIILKNDLNNIPYLSKFIPFEIESEKIVPFTLIGIGFIFIIKNLCLAFFANFLVRFGLDTGKRLGQTLYEGYIKLPYLKFVEKKYSSLIYNTTRAIDLFRDSLHLVAVLFTEILIFIGILSFLFLIDPYTLYVVGAVMVILFLLVYTLNKKKNIEWGKKSQFYETARVKTLMESFNSIKELKIKNIENFFFKEHQFSNDLKAEYAAKHNFNIYLPKLFFEIVILFTILTIVFILRELNFSQNDLITKIGLFSAAAFRLYPSTYKIINSLQNFNFGLPAIVSINDEIKDIVLTESEERTKLSTIDKNFNFEKLNVNNLYFRYPNRDNYILENLSLEIKKNEIVGIKGETGSGKSTLIDIISGLLKPTKGKFFLNGKELNYLPKSWNINFSYVSQNIALLDNSIKKNITFGDENNLDDNELEKIIEITQLKDMIKSSSKGLETLIGDKGIKISGGEKQRIGIARALYSKKDLLIMDEATNALDENTENKIMSDIKKIKNLTIILISHKKSSLSYCEKIFKLENKKIVEE
ncbi:MAG: ABC transporter ATP-binding protein [Candidatus Pelagibacter sp. TMED165]|nr:MAG: ABC transporter ATP-binding protein [Candidatus Pelagibacter sp. TMED165]